MCVYDICIYCMYIYIAILPSRNGEPRSYHQRFPPNESRHLQCLQPPLAATTMLPQQLQWLIMMAQARQGRDWIVLVRLFKHVQTF